MGNAFRFTRFLFAVIGVMGAARGTEVQVATGDPKHPNQRVAFTLK